MQPCTVLCAQVLLRAGQPPRCTCSGQESAAAREQTLESHVSGPLNADCFDFTSAETLPTCRADDCRVFVRFNLQRLETCLSRSSARHVDFCFLARYLSARTNTTLTSIKAELNFTTLKAKENESSSNQMFYPHVCGIKSLARG